MADDLTTKQLADENAALRNTLHAERAELEQQIAEVQKQASGGMNDEDIRRIEHPEEFVEADSKSKKP